MAQSYSYIKAFGAHRACYPFGIGNLVVSNWAFESAPRVEFHRSKYGALTSYAINLFSNQSKKDIIERFDDGFKIRTLLSCFS